MTGKTDKWTAETSKRTQARAGPTYSQPEGELAANAAVRVFEERVRHLPQLERMEAMDDVLVLLRRLRRKWASEA